MNKNVLFTVLGIIIVIGLGMLLVKGLSKEDDWICQNGAWVKHGNPSEPMPTGTCKEGFKLPFGGQKEESQANMVNPASKNCVDKGGKLETVKETAGEIGVCKFNDGTQCEEWKFFREECQKGQSKQADLSHAYLGVISKNTSGYAFKSNGVDYQLKTPLGASKELIERLEVEVKSKSEVTIIAAETPLLSKILILKNFLEK